MNLLQNVMGNIAEAPPEQIQRELHEILIDGEIVAKAFKLFRDQVVLTNYRILTLDKQGVTGTKQDLVSIPYSSVRKFSKESAGVLDLDAEMRIWVRGETQPIKWQFSRGVNVNEVYRLLSQFVLGNH